MLAVFRYYMRYIIRLNPRDGVRMKLRITTIGNSAGVILPKDLLDRLRLQKGDELYVLETPDGFRVTPYDPKLAAEMAVAERVMRKDRDLLRKLAE